MELHAEYQPDTLSEFEVMSQKIEEPYKMYVEEISQGFFKFSRHKNAIEESKAMNRKVQCSSPPTKRTKTKSMLVKDLRINGDIPDE